MSKSAHIWAITGAAGRIGTVLRKGLAADVAEMRCLDIRPVEDLGDREVAYQIDLSDLNATERAFRGCAGVVHLGGYPTEADFHDLARVNIEGTYHVLEAARRAGVARVAYASSNRITGFYRVGTVVSTEAPVRPDGLYGVSKAAGEAVCRLYADKFGMSVVCARIGSFPEEPQNVRDLSTWVSRGDLVRAFRAAMTAEGVTFSIIYVVSRNKQLYWDTSPGHALGFDPQDSADDYANRFEGMPSRDRMAFQSREDQTSQENTLSAQRDPGTSAG